jgi:hypothetical protein
VLLLTPELLDTNGGGSMFVSPPEQDRVNAMASKKPAASAILVSCVLIFDPPLLRDEIEI